LFEGARKNWKYVAKAILFSIVFWLAQFSYQFFFFSAGNIQLSLVRSFSFTGTTLIALALLAGPFALFFPKRSFVVHRRTIGVIGFGYVLLHITAALNFVFGADLSKAYFSLDPFENAVVFGGLAQILFFPVWLSSTDWAVQKLGYKNWKTVHRLVYFGFIFSIAHFSRMNVQAILSPPGLLLAAATILAIVFQLAGFARTLQRKKSLLAAIMGLLIILFGLVLLSLVFSR